MELVCQLKTVLREVEFLEEAYCLHHDRMCPVNPRCVPGQEEKLWVEVAGTTCCPWSAMGAGLEWLDKATAPCLAWAFSLLYYLPDIILHECTPRFSEGTLIEILGHVEDAGHSVHARPTPEGQELAYRMESEVFSPVDLGVPTQRKRKYSAFFLAPFTQPPSQPFLDQYSRALTLDSSIYLVATEKQIKEEHEAMAAMASVDPDLLSEADWLNVLWSLNPGDIGRFEGFQVQPAHSLGMGSVTNK